ncbi:MAG TPA: DUF29 domain-containing protein [Bryobacteraceae bacterium]|jgi:hypothetical protein
MKATELYERDFFEWTQSNAALLRSGRFDQADIEHIAEEIEDMGKSERRALESRLEVLLQHLLKWQVQSGGRSQSWRSTIKLQRREIFRLLSQMPSLKPKLKAALKDAYDSGMLRASAGTGLPESSFPGRCPFTLDQILDENLLPE